MLLIRSGHRCTKKPNQRVDQRHRCRLYFLSRFRDASTRLHDGPSPSVFILRQCANAPARSHQDVEQKPGLIWRFRPCRQLFFRALSLCKKPTSLRLRLRGRLCTQTKKSCCRALSFCKRPGSLRLRFRSRSCAQTMKNSYGAFFCYTSRVGCRLLIARSEDAYSSSHQNSAWPNARQNAKMVI